MVLVLGQGYRDALPLVLQPRAQASFPPTARRALTVVACTQHGARWRQKATGSTTAVSTLERSCSGGGGGEGRERREGGGKGEGRGRRERGGEGEGRGGGGADVMLDMCVSIHTS